MLDSLRFVASAIAKKDYVPALTHYKIRDNRVTGFNGIFALSSDIDVDLDVMPNAVKFIAAVRACPEDEAIALNVTPAGKLAVKCGKFKSYVDCLPPDTVATWVEPEGEEVDLGPHFLDGIRKLAPSMGVDASRGWAMGIKLQKEFMFTTNNVMLIQYWHGTPIPFDVVIPDLAVRELIRIGEQPTKIQMTKTAISFWFGDNRWLRTNTLEGGRWPTDKLDQILSASNGPQVEFGEGFFENLETLKPFLGDHGSVYMTNSQLATSQYEGVGTMIEFDNPVIEGMQAYHHAQLMILGELAKTIDWTAYPRPLMFLGDRLRGAIVGQTI